MTEPKRKTSMSVREMRRLLGLGKTESYWLLKKSYFKTITVAGKKRVMIDSFEAWYANQCKYRKVDGTPPGEEIQRTTLSVTELGQLLGISEASAYVLISKGHFEQVPVLGKMRITKDSFDQWYQTQQTYRTEADQIRDNELMKSAYTIPEIARMLGLHRNLAYYLVSKNLFEIIQIGNRRCITRASFQQWYESQSHYKLVAEDGVQEGRD